MSLDMFQAVVQGYSDSLLDQQIIALQTGYWAAYYVGVKHPKPVDKLAEDMVAKHNQKQQGALKASTPRPEVDVESFLAREERFRAKLAQQGR